jgi:uncharacterized protein YutE (UPF0331/DUF86 family)
MHDIERLDLIIKDIEVYMKKLEAFEINSEKDLEDDKNFFSSSMIIFSIINRAIDLAEEIISQKSLTVAFKYSELFDSLANAKIISKKTAEECKRLIGLRNKISHRYGKVNKKEILDAINSLGAINSFIKDVEKEVKRK